MSMFSIQILFPPESLLFTSFLWIGTDKHFFLLDKPMEKTQNGGFIRLETEVG